MNYYITRISQSINDYYHFDMKACTSIFFDISTQRAINIYMNEHLLIIVIDL
jgi:hypothetical protein